MTKLEETNEMIENINELKKTNEMIKTANKINKIIPEPGAYNDDVIRERTRTAALFDIAKSLAIIADGITTQNEHIEKIESDIYRIERRYDAKSVRWP